LTGFDTDGEFEAEADFLGDDIFFGDPTSVGGCFLGDALDGEASIS
jgi:hypothetical protein